MNTFLWYTLHWIQHDSKHGPIKALNNYWRCPSPVLFPSQFPHFPQGILESTSAFPCTLPLLISENGSQNSLLPVIVLEDSTRAIFLDVGGFSTLFVMTNSPFGDRRIVPSEVIPRTGDGVADLSLRQSSLGFLSDLRPSPAGVDNKIIATQEIESRYQYLPLGSSAPEFSLYLYSKSPCTGTGLPSTRVSVSFILLGISIVALLVAVGIVGLNWSCDNWHVCTCIYRAWHHILGLQFAGPLRIAPLIQRLHAYTVHNMHCMCGVLYLLVCLTCIACGMLAPRSNDIPSKDLIKD